MYNGLCLVSQKFQIMCLHDPSAEPLAKPKIAFSGSDRTSHLVLSQCKAKDTWRVYLELVQLLRVCMYVVRKK